MGNINNISSFINNQFKRLIEEIEEAPSFSDLETKKQAQVWDWNIAPMFKAWAEIASEMKNKNDFQKNLASARFWENYVDLLIC